MIQPFQFVFNIIFIDNSVKVVLVDSQEESEMGSRTVNSELSHVSNTLMALQSQNMCSCKSLHMLWALKGIWELVER
jgi:hypothetical protein